MEHISRAICGSVAFAAAAALIIIKGSIAWPIVFIFVGLAVMSSSLGGEEEEKKDG